VQFFVAEQYENDVENNMLKTRLAIQRYLKQVGYDSLRAAGVFGVFGGIAFITSLIINNEAPSSVPKQARVDYSTDLDIQAHCPQSEGINKKTISYKGILPLAIDQEHVIAAELPFHDDSPFLRHNIERIRNTIVDEAPNKTHRVSINSDGGSLYIHDRILDDFSNTQAILITHVRDSGYSAAFTLAISADIRFGEKDTKFMSHGARHRNSLLSAEHDSTKIQEMNKNIKNRRNPKLRKIIRDNSEQKLTDKCVEFLVRDDYTDVYYTAEDMLNAGLLEAYFNRVTKEITYNADTIEFSGENIINLRTNYRQAKPQPSSP